MKSALVMKETLADRVDATTDKASCPELFPPDKELAKKWFGEAIGAYEAAKVAAADIGVDPPLLSQMRSGAKAVSLTHIARIFVGNRQAFAAMVQAMAVDAGLRVERRSNIELSTSEARLLGFLKRSGLWRFLGPILAGEFYGTDLDLLNAAIEMSERR